MCVWLCVVVCVAWGAVIAAVGCEFRKGFRNYVLVCCDKQAACNLGCVRGKKTNGISVAAARPNRGRR